MKLLAVPAHWPPRYNSCTDACDMISGPCACGAWHRMTEAWVREHIEKHGP